MGVRSRGQRERFGAGRLLLLLLVVVSAYFAVTAAQVGWAANRDTAQSAEAIVVLGAAQYDGEPSAALEGRLDHARELFEEGVAPLIVVTGGRQEGDRFTEAAAGARYLERTGVPGTSIERETTGASSYASLAATARFLREEDFGSVVLVSDPFHNYRISAIAAEVGLDAQTSASTTSPFSGASELRQMGRETVAVSIGRAVGYRRLDDLGLRFEQLRT